MVHRLDRLTSGLTLFAKDAKVAKAFGEDLNQPFTVVPTYAMTESFPICSNPPSLEIRLSTVGPAMGPRIKILAGHPEDAELPHGTEGEVCVEGACVTAGYLMREHMAQDPNIEAFSLPTSSVGRMLRTGDKGYLDAAGYVQLVGRFKEIINCGGEKLSPLELEAQLGALPQALPGVRACVANSIVRSIMCRRKRRSTSVHGPPSSQSSGCERACTMWQWPERALEVLRASA